jgi:hypothetical protein
MSKVRRRFRHKFEDVAVPNRKKYSHPFKAQWLLYIPPALTH